MTTLVRSVNIERPAMFGFVVGYTQFGSDVNHLNAITFLDLLTQIERLLELYPYIEREDVLETLRYASWLASEREIAFEAAD